MHPFGELYQPSKLVHYPHMFEKDVEIWERFLERHGAEYTGFIYDWKVGSGSEPVEGMKEPYVSMQQTLSKYRVDVIGVKAGRIELIEVKPSAGTSAVGQIISYLKLYVKEHKPTVPVVPVIVTDFERPDIRRLASDFGIKYYVL